MGETSQSGSRQALALATISFALSFAAWGLVGGLASVFTGLYELTAVADRAAGRRARAARVAGAPADGHADRSLRRTPGVHRRCSCSPRWPRSLVPLTVELRHAPRRRRSSSAWPARPSRSGAAFVSRWTPAARQGTALGVYGLGTMGQSLAVFGGPVVGRGVRAGKRCSGARRVALLVWAVRLLAVRAESAQQPATPATVAAMLGVLRRAPDGLAARRLLLPDVRRLRRVLDLPADAAAHAVRPDAGGCRLPRRGIRRARHAHATGGRLARRPDWRRTGAVVGVRRRGGLRVAPDVADRWCRSRSARSSCAMLPGARQRRGVQAGARALPEGDRHGDRPRRRARRPGRVLPAAAARRVPRSARRHLAGLRAAVGHGARAALRQPARVPPGRRRLAHHPVAGSPPPRSSGSEPRAWAALVTALAGGRHRRRVAAPAALRRGARRLHVRDALRRVRHHAIATRCGCSVRRRACTGGAAGRRSSARPRLGTQPRVSSRAAALAGVRRQHASSSGAARCAGARTG